MPTILLVTTQHIFTLSSMASSLLTRRWFGCACVVCKVFCCRLVRTKCELGHAHLHAPHIHANTRVISSPSLTPINIQNTTRTFVVYTIECVERFKIHCTLFTFTLPRSSYASFIVYYRWAAKTRKYTCTRLALWSCPMPIQGYQIEPRYLLHVAIRTANCEEIFTRIAVFTNRDQEAAMVIWINLGWVGFEAHKQLYARTG